MRSLACAILLLALLTGSARAQDDSFPVEPGKINANDAGVLDPGVGEFQPGYAGFYSNRSYDASGVSQPDSSIRQELWGAQFTYGMVSDLDVNLTLGMAGAGDSVAGLDPVTGETFPLSGHGLSDLTIGTRWRFYQDEDGLSLAYLTSTTFPTGQSSLGQNVSLSPDQDLSLSQGIATMTHRLVVQKEAGHWSLIADLGVQHPLASNSGLEYGLSPILAAGYQVTEEFQPLVEVGYNSATFAGEPFSDAWAVTLGGNYYVTPDIRLNLGVTQTVAGHSARDGLGVAFFVTIAR